jgi:hypothetical protein
LPRGSGDCHERRDNGRRPRRPRHHRNYPGYDGRNQPKVIPALAITGASLDARNEEADDFLAGLELLGNVAIAPLNGAEQAARLADVIARTGLDSWDAHAAAIGVSTLLTLMNRCRS